MRFLFATIISLFVICSTAEAAELFLRNAVEPGQNSIFIDVVADTSGNTINSIEAAIHYPSDVLAFSGYQSGGGVVGFWIEQPHAVAGVVQFAGGIPGGVARDTDGNTVLPLVRLIFSPLKSVPADLSITHSTLLLNDGKGTALAHTTKGVQLEVPGKTTSGTDTTPPEPFIATLIPADRSSRTPAMITFLATDRDSGIKMYQVKSGFGFWKEIQGAYPVRNTLISHFVYIKAIDAFGNSTVTKVRVPGTFPFWSVIVAALVVAGSVWRIFVVKNKV